MIIQAIVEMPANTCYKYEAEHIYNAEGLYKLKLDRVVNRRIPYNYGFVTETRSPDGDPLDLFILSVDPIPPLTRVNVEILYAIKCTDNGVSDDKLVGKLVGDIVPPFAYESIYAYLTTYKSGFTVQRQTGQEEAINIFKECLKCVIKNR